MFRTISNRIIAIFRQFGTWFAGIFRSRQAGNIGSLLQSLISSIWHNLSHLFRLIIYRKQLKCPYCFTEFSRYQITSKLNPKCPSCREELPTDLIYNYSKNIALIGGKFVGKTTFIINLIHQLKTNEILKDEFTDEKFHGIFGDKNTKDWYETNNIMLFRDLETPLATSPTDPQLSKPKIFRLIKSNGNKSESIFLSFFDTAGETYIDKSKILASHPNIFNADGFIFLIDPTQIESIKNIIIEKHTDLDVTNFSKISNYEIAYYIYEIFRDKNIVKHNKTIKLPVAICISKSDYLKSLNDFSLPQIPYDNNSDNGSSDCIMPPFDKHFFDEVRYISDELKEFLNRHDKDRLLNNLNTYYSNYCFFPISVFGEPPINGKPLNNFRSQGTLNPILWILKEIKFIK